MVSAQQPAMNASGTSGKPHVRYGRGKSGAVRRSTITAAAARPRNSHWEKTYSEYSSSNVPVTAIAQAIAVWRRSAPPGVRNLGDTRAVNGKNSPSRPSAYGMRALVRVSELRLPSADSIIAIVIHHDAPRPAAASTRSATTEGDWTTCANGRTRNTAAFTSR